MTRQTVVWSVLWVAALAGCEPSATCEWEGKVYAAGEGWMEECNGCGCTADGSVVCTTAACVCAGGKDNIEFYPWGATFMSADGCNVCTCEEGEAVCEDECDVCELAFEQAGMCSPHAVFWYNPERQACEEKTFGGCDGSGNANNFDTLTECAATCSSASGGAGTSCLVDGLIYSSGERVEDPFSCNACECEDGRLGGCTEIACPMACPPNTVEGTTCAQCGAAGGCYVLETACLPVCSSDDDCSSPRPFCDVDAGHCAGEPPCD